MIYIRNLFKSHEKLRDIRTSSYIDDIDLITVSKSIKKNCKKLKKVMQIMLERQEENLVKFDQDKTELIYFHYKYSEEDLIQVQNLTSFNDVTVSRRLKMTTFVTVLCLFLINIRLDNTSVNFHSYKTYVYVKVMIFDF
jgi:hypothetical protein